MFDVNFPRDMVLSEQSKGPDELVAGGNRQMKHEVAASTIGAPISETSPTVPPPLPMPAPEAFASEHLAMDRNPVTTAQASWVDPSTSLKRSSSTAFTTPAPPVSTPAQEKNTGSGQSSESSTAGGAAAQVTKSTSRITFDGTPLCVLIAHSVRTLIHAIKAGH